MKSKFLETLPQYHFERDDFVRVFYDIFSNEEVIDIQVECECNQQYDYFSLESYDNEYYIIHRDSGTIINWYKHLGRTNTCNKEGFTLEDLREFLLLLKNDMESVRR